MSTGAELAVIGSPIAGLALLAVGTLAVATTVGGIAIVGTGRLCVAAGSYVTDRVRERATLCANEYTQYQSLRARAVAIAAQATSQPARAPRQALPPQQMWANRLQPQHSFARGDIGRFHDNDAIAETIIANLEQRLTSSQQAADQRIQVTQRRAYLAAMLDIEGARLPSALQSGLRAALADEGADLDAALLSLNSALGQLATEERTQRQNALRQLEAEASALSAIVIDDSLRDEFLMLRRQIDAAARSTDNDLLIQRYGQFQGALARLRLRHEQSRFDLHARELAEVWGLLQALGGLLSDLQSIASTGAVSLDSTLMPQFTALSARYETLEAGDVVELAAFREEARKIRMDLEELQNKAIQILNRYQQSRLVAEIEQSLGEIKLDDLVFESVTQRVESDGTVVLRGRQEEQTLEVRVQPDGRVKYEAYGFGDERCLKVAYALVDRLVDRDIMLREAEPELTRQATVVTQVIAALQQMDAYGEHEITIHEDAAAVVIEAGRIGFQRRLAIDTQGIVTPIDNAPTAPPARGVIEQAQQPEAVAAAREKVERLRSTLRRQRQQT